MPAGPQAIPSRCRTGDPGSAPSPAVATGRRLGTTKESTMMDKENEDKTIVLSPDDLDVLITYTIDDEIDFKQ